MARKSTSDAILAQILSCLDAAAARPGLVRASVHQTEGYLKGLQGQAWENTADVPPAAEDTAGLFLHDVRMGRVPLRGRIKKESSTSVASFLEGLEKSFPQSNTKSFANALARLWARWSGYEAKSSQDVGRRVGQALKAEYEEGIAGELSAYLLDDRIHLRSIRGYLRMRGWLQGTIEHLRRKSDWRSRETAKILESNLSSIVLRALHNSSVDYAALTVAKLPSMMAQLDRAIATLSKTEPEASHFLSKNRSTILTHALHSGYLDYPEEAAQDLPKTLRELNGRILKLESESPEAARNLRSNVASLIYRALTNGDLDSLLNIE